LGQLGYWGLLTGGNGAILAQDKRNGWDRGGLEVVKGRSVGRRWRRRLGVKPARLALFGLLRHPTIN
jgi:hypothetical protein